MSRTLSPQIAACSKDSLQNSGHLPVRKQAMPTRREATAVRSGTPHLAHAAASTAAVCVPQDERGCVAKSEHGVGARPSTAKRTRSTACATPLDSAGNTTPNKHARVVATLPSSDRPPRRQLALASPRGSIQVWPGARAVAENPRRGRVRMRLTGFSFRRCLCIDAFAMPR